MKHSTHTAELDRQAYFNRLRSMFCESPVPRFEKQDEHITIAEQFAKDCHTTDTEYTALIQSLQPPHSNTIDTLLELLVRERERRHAAQSLIFTETVKQCTADFFVRFPYDGTYALLKPQELDESVKRANGSPSLQQMYQALCHYARLITDAENPVQLSIVIDNNFKPSEVVLPANGRRPGYSCARAMLLRYVNAYARESGSGYYAKDEKEERVHCLQPKTYRQPMRSLHFTENPNLKPDIDMQSPFAQCQTDSTDLRYAAHRLTCQFADHMLITNIQKQMEKEC